MLLYCIIPQQMHLDDACQHQEGLAIDARTWGSGSTNLQRDAGIDDASERFAFAFLTPTLPIYSGVS